MKKWNVGSLAVCLLAVSAGLANGTEVALYTESCLLPDESRLRVRVFADISDVSSGGPLLSAGFALSYSNIVTNPVAEKNVVDWYFGTPAELQAYMEPDVSQDGEVVFMLGRLNETDPTHGLSGNRVFLGSVLFDYDGSSPAAADLAMADGHSGQFADFVTTQGVVLDPGVSYSVPELVSLESLQMQGAIRALQLLSGIESDQPARVAPDDVTGDGRIGIEEPIALLRQMAY